MPVAVHNAQIAHDADKILFTDDMIPQINPATATLLFSGSMPLLMRDKAIAPSTIPAIEQTGATYSANGTKEPPNPIIPHISEIIAIFFTVIITS